MSCYSTTKLSNNSLIVVDSFLFIKQRFKNSGEFVHLFSNKHRGNTVVTTGVGREKMRSFVNDIVYLRIQTNSGSLNYSYE